MKKIMSIVLFLAFAIMAAKIPSGVVLTDREGNTYDLDAILASGKSIIVHKTSTN